MFCNKFESIGRKPPFYYLNRLILISHYSFLDSPGAMPRYAGLHRLGHPQGDQTVQDTEYSLHLQLIATGKPRSARKLRLGSSHHGTETESAQIKHDITRPYTQKTTTTTTTNQTPMSSLRTNKYYQQQPLFSSFLSLYSVLFYYTTLGNIFPFNILAKCN